MNPPAIPDLPDEFDTDDSPSGAIAWIVCTIAFVTGAAMAAGVMIASTEWRAM